jgi:hypothetical protein
LILLAFYAADTRGGFSSLAAVAELFSNQWLLLAGWVHYLAFDLFVGTWETRDAVDREPGRAEHARTHFAPDRTCRLRIFLKPCLYGYGRRNGAGVANLAGSIATLGRTSLSAMVFCPSVQLTIVRKGIFTPATSR